MKKLVLVFSIAFAFCPMAMASDIAISTQAGWYSQAAADREMQEIVDNVKGISIEVFTSTQQNALADWVIDHTGDGAADLLILNGQFPDTIYTPGNAQADDSLAELFLDDGNVIINTGDYMFYVVNGAGTNAEGGLQTMMDIPGITMWDDDTAVTVTAEGQQYTPTLQNFATDRPFHLDQLQGDWQPELILAQNAAGTRAEPVIVVNTVTGGRLGIFYQTSGQDNDPRGEVISEWINNWYLQFVAAGNPYARRPSPDDGALHPDTWVTLSWTAGDFAVSHDVYLSDNFDDVNDGTGDAFRGNQASPYYVAGFPGFAYPEGLVPGTTYYWRVDEVNDANPESPWRGNVWSFSVPPKKAYNPVPADGSKFIDSVDPTVSWTAGFGAKLHTIYFGDDFNTVADATTGIPGALTTYKPGPLETEKTYYWRIDEFDGVETHQGDVWSFKTAKVGGGLKGEYFNNVDLSGPPVLVRIDPQINFYWNPGPNPPPGVNEDNFSVRWTGELEAPFSEPFTFIIGCDDGARMYLNGELIIDDWGAAGHDYTETYSQPIDLVEGRYYSMVVEGFELGGEAEWRLFWQSPSLPRDYVPQAALSPPIKASGAYPANGATGTSLTPILTWDPGDYAASHEVYFGMDAGAVASATKASPEFKATKALGDESYDPGPLAWNTTYYWRVDEVNDLHPDSPWIGSVWSFTTGDFLLVDDFESYTDDDMAGEAIWQHWIDGFGVAGNGSQVGYLLPPYAEQTIVHGGLQSMPLFYNNAVGVTNSEAVLTLMAPRDWTAENVAELSLWFRGLPGSVGSFTEGPAGTYTMTGSGTDIWDVGPGVGEYGDEFHFAYKTLTGAGSITARVMSVQNTNDWAKAGVMIRETLDAGSKHGFACITPSNGVASQGRQDTGGASFNTNQAGITAPHWVKLERTNSGSFIVSHSPNGTAWSPVTGAIPQSITMPATVYIGLALTSHDAALTCQAVFSNVTTTGNVSGQWMNQDIGIESNAAEPLYVAISNASGAPAVVANEDPAAAQIDAWTPWIIPLQAFSDQGINLRNVDKIAIGLGSTGGVSAGGSGTMYIDDIRLYRAGEAAGQ
jgi:hypothetical protein